MMALMIGAIMSVSDSPFIEEKRKRKKAHDDDVVEVKAGDSQLT